VTEQECSLAVSAELRPQAVRKPKLLRARGC